MRWCIGTITGEYLANMEDILDIYAENPQENVPRICFDERPCQLLDDVLTPIPPKPNCTKKEHQEYIRNGVCNVLLAYDIDAGKRYLMVTKTKNKCDYALFMKWLINTHYPKVDSIKLIQDNYNTLALRSVPLRRCVRCSVPLRQFHCGSSTGAPNNHTKPLFSFKFIPQISYT
jgi:hypothetical protein